MKKLQNDRVNSLENESSRNRENLHNLKAADSNAVRVYIDRHSFSRLHVDNTDRHRVYAVFTRKVERCRLVSLWYSDGVSHKYVYFVLFDLILYVNNLLVM